MKNVLEISLSFDQSEAAQERLLITALLPTIRLAKESKLPEMQAIAEMWEFKFQEALEGQS